MSTLRKVAKIVKWTAEAPQSPVAAPLWAAEGANAVRKVVVSAYGDTPEQKAAIARCDDRLAAGKDKVIRQPDRWMPHA